MALSQYAFAFEPDEVDPPFKLKLKSAFHYPFYQWGKHYQLYEWMKSLYDLKGGNGEFNDDYVQLTREDILALDKATDDLNFYGQFENINQARWERNHDKEFIHYALIHLDLSYIVMYCALSKYV